MAKKTFNVDIENFEILAEDYSDEQLKYMFVTMETIDIMFPFLNKL